MLSNDDEIKNELQGDGFLDEVKEHRLPDSEELSAEAIEKYEKQFAPLTAGTVKNNADRILRRLLQLEREIYEKREEQVYKEALVVFLRQKYDTGQTSIRAFTDSTDDSGYTEYPHLQRMFESIEEIYESNEGFEATFEKILPLLYPANDSISVSAQQSRRKRAGTSLQNHLENLLEKAGFFIAESRIAGNGQAYRLSTTDPDAASGEIDGKPVYISSLTTMRDRFRQSLSDNPGGFDAKELPQFITTASGNNLATTSAQNDVTKEKVEEIVSEGFTLVIFDEIKEEEFPDDRGVISYSQFFSNRLPSAIKD